MSSQERELRQKLKELRDHVTRTPTTSAQNLRRGAQDHYGETEHRSIYGEASPDEAKALHEEGSSFIPADIAGRSELMPTRRRRTDSRSAARKR